MEVMIFLRNRIEQMAMLSSTMVLIKNRLKVFTEMPIAAQHLKAARLHLQKNDSVMKQIIRRVGPCQIKLKRDYFQSLIWTIVGQQVSAAAAETVFERLKNAIGEKTIRPESIQDLGIDGIRELGITRPKAGYMVGLADSVLEGNLVLTNFGRKTNEEVIEELTAIKGIGLWTAQIFLIFTLGRLDVFPIGDLAIRTAIQKNYELRQSPSDKKLSTIAKKWQPYQSVACWYLWRTIHLDRATT